MPSEKLSRFKLTAVLRMSTSFTTEQLRQSLKDAFYASFLLSDHGEKIITLALEELTETADAC